MFRAASPRRAQLAQRRCAGRRKAANRPGTKSTRRGTTSHTCRRSQRARPEPPDLPVAPVARQGWSCLLEWPRPQERRGPSTTRPAPATTPGPQPLAGRRRRRPCCRHLAGTGGRSRPKIRCAPRSGVARMRRRRLT
eukprot:scaffold8111_cov110-Isochrysis_galbana.AAC.1